jgi:hypothetical protein
MVAATLNDTAKPAPERSPYRGTGRLAMATGIAAFALLAVHPGGTATDFAGVLKEEAANRGADALVHGGFVVVLALQAVCYAVFSARLGWQRSAVVAGFVFFCAGAIFLSGSMVLDGLVTPAVAARYLAAPAKIDYARALFVLIGTLISVLMPAGIAFQGGAIAAWGAALAASGKRALGMFGVLLGMAMIAGVAIGIATANPMALMGGIVGTALWAVVCGTTLMRSS